MHISFSVENGTIKPMHAVNNIPLTGVTGRMHHYVGEAGIPFIRLHDTGGAYGMNRFVDVENIFRNWDADENDPASYDFAFTDWLLQEIATQKAEIFFRLGTTIENGQHIKAYRIYPPKDPHKWARICGRIIAHYNEGWADGFHLGIRYWEIWNEPDNYPDIEDNCMWKGTFEEYLDLYKASASYLKAQYPALKIGGYASCGFYALFEKGYVESAHSSSRTEYFIECFHKFMRFVRDNKLPLDFFSWHSYSDAEKNIVYAKYVREQLDGYGFTHTESILNEWNPGTKRRGTLEDSAYIADMMLKMQDTDCDMLMYYDGQVNGSYNGLYSPLSFEPFPAYYALKAFHELYKRKNQGKVSDVPAGISCVCAADEEGSAVMMTNMGEKKSIPVSVEGEKCFRIYRIAQNKALSFESEIHLPAEITLDRYETVLLLNDE